MKNYLTWDEHKKELLKNPKFRAALKETELEYQVARQLIIARIEKGLTQKELARRMKTKQSVISRVENGRTTPTLSFLKRLADVVDRELTISFT